MLHNQHLERGQVVIFTTSRPGCFLIGQWLGLSWDDCAGVGAPAMLSTAVDPEGKPLTQLRVFPECRDGQLLVPYRSHLFVAVGPLGDEGLIEAYTSRVNPPDVGPVGDDDSDAPAHYRLPGDRGRNERVVVLPGWAPGNWLAGRWQGDSDKDGLLIHNPLLIIEEKRAGRHVLGADYMPGYAEGALYVNRHSYVGVATASERWRRLYEEMTGGEE